MLTEVRTVPPQAPPVEPVESLTRRALRLLPGVLVLLVVVVVLWHHGVGGWVQARFAAHLLGVVTVPGMLVWRALRGGSGTLPFDLVGGVALGYAMEIGWYIAGRAAGFPYLHVVAAVVVVGVFLAVPRLRRHWRGGPTTDVRWSVAVAVLCLSMVAWASATYLGPHPLTWPGAGNPNQDMVFHQALVSELRHHMPAQMPYVVGVPLAYHWFVHADWAAASWSTGIEPFMLTYRLGLMPAVVLIVVAIAVVAQRIAPGRWWSGPLAALLALFALPGLPQTRGLPGVPSADMPGTMWLSPSQTFGGLLFAAAVLALVDLLRPDEPEQRPSVRRWVLFGLVMAGATGGKATFAPLLLAGLGAVVAVGLLRRRLERRAAVAAVITLVIFVIAMRTMFAGTSGGLFIDPLASIQPGGGWTVGGLLVVWALGWAAVLAAGAILLYRRRWTDPMLVACAGICAAALGLVLLTRQLGGSQIYFLISARPYAAVLVVAALVAVAPGAAVGRWAGWSVIPAVLCGVGATLIALPLALAASGKGTAVAMIWPHAVPLLAAVAVGLLLFGLPRTRPVAIVAAGAVLLGAAVPGSNSNKWNTMEIRRHATGVPAKPSATWTPMVPPGAQEAGRWLRDSTGVDDLLASNNHCRIDKPFCDPRQFWLAAFSERRVLLEGWAYTPPGNDLAVQGKLASSRTPYWDPGKLAVNDAAYLRPSAETLGALRSRYGVRWLVVDTRKPYDRAALGRVAQLRYQSGQVAVYQVGG